MSDDYDWEAQITPPRVPVISFISGRYWRFKKIQICLKISDFQFCNNIPCNSIENQFRCSPDRITESFDQN